MCKMNVIIFSAEVLMNDLGLYLFNILPKEDGTFSGFGLGMCMVFAVISLELDLCFWD